MSESPQIDRFAALRYRDFRLLWIGQIISNAGSQMQIVALNWQIYLLTNSAFALGLIGLFRFLPIILFSLIGGTFADAHNRKKIMLVTQSVLAILSLILAVTTITHTITSPLIYLLTIGAAIAISFDIPARQALIPSLVEKKHLANALSLNTIMFQISTIVGPSLAGLLIAKSGVGSIYVFNAFSFIAVLIALFQMNASGAITGTRGEISLGAIREGLKFVKSKTIIWSTMVLDFFSTFFSSATALLPIFAKDILHVGPQGLGLLYAAPAVGAILAGFFVTHTGALKKQGILLLTSVTLYAGATIVFGFSKIFLLSLLALLFVGLGDGISTIIRNTIRQLATPDYIRGRMTSVNMIFFMGGPQLGEFEAGVLAATVGAPLSVVFGGLGTLLIVGIMAITIPVLRRYQDHNDLKVISQKE